MKMIGRLSPVLVNDNINQTQRNLWIPSCNSILILNMKRLIYHKIKPQFHKCKAKLSSK